LLSKWSIKGTEVDVVVVVVPKATSRTFWYRNGSVLKWTTQWYRTWQVPKY